MEAGQAEKYKQLVAYIEQQNAETLRSARWIAGDYDAAHKRDQVSRRLAMAQPGESGESK